MPEAINTPQPEVLNIIISWFLFLILEEENDRLSGNVGKEIPLYATLFPRKAPISYIRTEFSNILFNFLEKFR
jgi:hypothetical protein